MNLCSLYSFSDGDPKHTVPAFNDDFSIRLSPKLSGSHVDKGRPTHQQHRRSCSTTAVGRNQSQAHSSTNLSHSHSTENLHLHTSKESSPRPSVVPASETEGLIHSILGQKQVPWDHHVSDRDLYMLLFSVLESVSSLHGTRGTSKISSTLRLLQNVTSLFEDTLALWLQSYNKNTGVGTGMARDRQSRRSRSADHISLDSEELCYNGSLHLSRITLRLWLSLCSQLLHSSLQDQHLVEIQPLLHSPLEAISNACYNLQQAGIFKGNDSLDHEFTLIILEGLYSGLHVLNLYPEVPSCQIRNLYEGLRDVLTDGCQEWFAYLCSKLHQVFESSKHTPSAAVVGVAEVGVAGQSGGGVLGESPDRNSTLKEDDWRLVLRYSYSLLTHVLSELLTTSSHIKSCQQAFKLALASSGNSFKSPSSSFPFHRPIVYELEVAAGFDKLTFRMSKMAELLLSMFKEVPHVQLLSLQLLSETTKDTIGVIGNFLSIIADKSIYSNPKVLDPYLELLEDVWFRLSSDYTGSAPWSKLSNYSHLLLESDHQVACQVIYHLQCLFSHNSSTLRSQLTKRVVIPYHTHLMRLVKDKCYKATTVVSEERGGGAVKKSKGGKGGTATKVVQVVKMGCEADLADHEQVMLVQFLKLLIKVVSNPQSLGSFASNSSNLYVLFLLLPLDNFRGLGLQVLEECLYTVHDFGYTYSPPGSGVPSPVGTPGGGGGGFSEGLHQSPVHGESRPDETGIQKTLLQILLSVAYSVQIEKIPDQCLSIAEGRATLPKYGLAEADEVHKLIVSTFEHKTIKQLLTKPFLRHINVMADVWHLLSRLATRNESSAEILFSNHIWDVIQAFGPSLANVLSRLRQRQLRDGRELSEMEVAVQSLRECGVGLLSHLLVLGHFLCWQRRDQRVS